jgi:hypothetical protein
MRKPLKMALHFVVILAIVVATATVFAPPSPPSPPYLSALSDLTAPPAYAAGCPDKRCDRGVQCVSGVGYKCIRFNGKGCTATICG